MDAVVALSLVFLAGLTMCGLCGTVIELVAERRLSLREPFVSSTSLSRSIALVLLAGPFMMINEALAASGEGRVGRLAFAAVLCFCMVWLIAMGTVVLGLLEGTGDSLV